MADKSNAWSGLSDQESEEFHRYYIQGTVFFVAVAVVAAEPGLVDGGCLVGWGGRAAQVAGIDDGASRGQGGGNSGQGGNLAHGAILRRPGRMSPG